MLNFSSLAKGNFDKLTQVCFGGVSKFQSQYIWFTRAKRLCIASKQEIKRSLIVEFDNFRSQGDPRSCNRACKWLKYHPALKDHRLVKLWTRQLTRNILWFESDNGEIIPKKNHSQKIKCVFSAPVNGLKRGHGPLNFSLPHPGRHPAAAYPQQHYKVFTSSSSSPPSSWFTIWNAICVIWILGKTEIFKQKSP